MDEHPHERHPILVAQMMTHRADQGENITAIAADHGVTESYARHMIDAYRRLSPALIAAIVPFTEADVDAFAILFVQRLQGKDCGAQGSTLVKAAIRAIRDSFPREWDETLEESP